jgi:nitrate/nitrite-specific signal transduction histidine kinase
MLRRARSEDELAQHRFLTQHLANQHEFDELARFITHFFGAILPIEHAALFIYDHRRVRLAFAQAWSATEVVSSQIAPAIVTRGICRSCQNPQAARLHSVSECNIVPASTADSRLSEYCLPLVCHNLLIGVLQVRCRAGQDLNKRQKEFLSGIAQELALALALSIAQQRQMTQARIDAQIDERRQIARELHCSLAQQIGYLHLNLDRLTNADYAINPRTLRQELQQMREVADDAYTRIRNNLGTLRAWEQTDLTQSIASYARKVAHRADLQIDLQMEGDAIRLAAQECQQVFGLIQESLSNVEAHAHAKKVRVWLRWLGRCLQIEVHDDGVGFDPATVVHGHYGLKMMRERVLRLGGDLRLDSQQGLGTQLKFMIPLPDRATHKYTQT